MGFAIESTGCRDSAAWMDCERDLRTLVRKRVWWSVSGRLRFGMWKFSFSWGREGAGLGGFGWR